MNGPALDRSVLFFGGKGGVGKTTLAAAIAIMSADRGDRTLLVSTDPAHSTSDALGMDLGGQATEVLSNLWALEIDPVEETERYIKQVKARIAESTPPRLAAEVERQIDIARVTPGADESALFDRFTSILTELGSRYDRLVFDTAPLGHTLRLLSLPELMNTWIDGLIARRKKVNVLGRMWRTVSGAAQGGVRDSDPVLDALQDRRDRFEHARQVMTDAKTTGFVFVVIPEHLAISETERSVTVLDRHAIPVAAVIVNQCNRGSDREREQAYLTRLKRRFHGHPIFEVSRLGQEPHGIDGLRQLIAAIPRGVFEL